MAAIRRWTRRVPALVFSALTIVALAVGWSYRDENILTPQTGTGYWLGIVGGSAMLLLLLYPLRKRMRWLRSAGNVTWWFRIHMMLGIIGPVLILFHTNFRLGSTNSNVALAVMLTVAASGIIGRYIYAKIHLGLYGRRAEIADFLSDLDAVKDLFGTDVDDASLIVEQLTEFSKTVSRSPRSLIGSLFALIAFEFRSRRHRRRVLASAYQLVDAEARRKRFTRRIRQRARRSIRDHIYEYFRAERRLARFTVFERLFAAWHVLHLPLFIVLIITAVLHVAAVHIY